VYLFNVTLIALVLAAFFNAFYLTALLNLLTLKIMVEVLFLLPVATFFGKRKSLFIFPFLQPLHILYIGLAGFLGYIGKYEWKGRHLK